MIVRWHGSQAGPARINRRAPTTLRRTARRPNVRRLRLIAELRDRGLRLDAIRAALEQLEAGGRSIVERGPVAIEEIAARPQPGEA